MLGVDEKLKIFLASSFNSFLQSERVNYRKKLSRGSWVFVLNAWSTSMILTLLITSFHSSSWIQLSNSYSLSSFFLPTIHNTRSIQCVLCAQMHAACSETIKSPGHGFLLQHQFDSSTSSFVAISAFFLLLLLAQNECSQQLYSMLNRLVQFLWFCVFCVFRLSLTHSRRFFFTFSTKSLYFYLTITIMRGTENQKYLHSISSDFFDCWIKYSRRRKAVKDDRIDNEVEGEIYWAK